jgi:hypothetical protein
MLLKLAVQLLMTTLALLLLPLVQLMTLPAPLLPLGVRRAGR